MEFSNTTTKTGILQTIERWCNLADGAITGDTTFIKTMTASVNDAFNTLIPLLLSFSDYIKWDDTNNTDLPIGTFSLVSGQSDYTIAQDANSLDIFNITSLRILPFATSTTYMDLYEMTSDDWRANEAMSPNTFSIGVPTHFLKYGNTIFLYPQPNYSVAAGVKIYFERQPSYFVSTDTTKKPGIPRPFHVLLALYPALEWNILNNPQNTAVITRIEARIAKVEKDLRNAIEGRNPHRSVMTTKRIRFR